MEPKMQIRRARCAVLILSFFCVIFAPFFGYLSGDFEEISNSEKRRLGEFPQLSLSKIYNFPAEFSEYFDDRFGFRNYLIDTNAILAARSIVFNSNPEIAIGVDGWLFRGSRTIQRFGGAHIIPPVELTAIRENLEEKRDWLKVRGIDYLLVITPLKHSVYPEYLPGWFQRVGPSVTDQVVDHIRQYSDVPVLDLRSAVALAKSQGLLFDKTDSHWNDLGGYFGYRSIFEHVGRRHNEITILELNEFALSTQEVGVGNLAKKLGATVGIDETTVELTPKTNRCHQVLPVSLVAPKPWARHQEPFQTYCSTAAPIKIVMLRDSFATAMIPLISETTQEATFIWQNARNHPQADSFPLMVDIVNRVDPHLVIDQVPERKLLSLKQ